MTDPAGAEARPASQADEVPASQAEESGGIPGSAVDATVRSLPSRTAASAAPAAFLASRLPAYRMFFLVRGSLTEPYLPSALR